MGAFCEGLDYDVQIDKIEGRLGIGGCWVVGRIEGTAAIEGDGVAAIAASGGEERRFEALVFAEHAENEDFELGRSRISKLHLRRTADRKTTYNFDRGLDLDAATPTDAELVAFLCAGLADVVHGPVPAA